MEIDDFQVMRFHVYKALSAISKTNKQIEDCNCTYAIESLDEATILLKKATKTTTLTNTHVLLEKTLEHVTEALEAIRNHEQHESPYGSDELTVNTTSISQRETVQEPPNGKLLREKIDIALKKYKLSLQKVIATVDCREARTFALRIYEGCEQQLLRTDLSEGKKYYNLKTKEITSDALDILGNCDEK